MKEGLQYEHTVLRMGHLAQAMERSAFAVSGLDITFNTVKLKGDLHF